MKIDEKIDKHLDEARSGSWEIEDFVKGIKSWLDLIEEAYSYGNFTLVKQTLKNIAKKVKEMEKKI